MLVQLRDLKPNPYRDFKIDPIDPENVKTLIESIRQDGFWGGVVCRQINGEIQIGAGHHRIEAARKAGLISADLFVGDLDDAAMIRVYARENATQRGNSGVAIAGSIASAIRFLVKQIMLGSDQVRKFTDLSNSEAIARLQGNLAGRDGLGYALILRFLEGVPGINESAVTAQLANLKASGDYQRIVREVSKEIEEEQREAAAELERTEREEAEAKAEAVQAEEQRKAATLKAKAAREKAEQKAAELERKRAATAEKLAKKRQAEAEKELKKFDALRIARKAAASVNGQIPTFDFEGVAKHLKNDDQIRVFRQIATAKGVKPYLPVNKQAALAAELVRLAKSTDQEISGAFIKNNVMSLVISTKAYERKLTKEEEAELERQDVRRRFDNLQQDFARNLRSLYSAGMQMLELMNKHRTTTFVISGEMRSNLATAQSVITKLAAKI
jgi:ParB/RepB/Spo0J family partition protein